MVEKSTVVKNKTGIHARPATSLVNFVKNYKGQVNLKNGEKTGNLKSILNIMSLGIVKGSEVTVQVIGEDEENFANSVIEYIDNLEG